MVGPAAAGCSSSRLASGSTRCMCACLRCVCVFANARMHACTHTCTHMHQCIHACMHAHVHEHASMNAYIQACIHVHTREHAQAIAAQSTNERIVYQDRVIYQDKILYKDKIVYISSPDPPSPGTRCSKHHELSTRVLTSALPRLPGHVRMRNVSDAACPHTNRRGKESALQGGAKW